MKKLVVKFKDIFSLFEMYKIPLNEVKELNEEIYVKTPNQDWVPIKGLIRKTDKKLRIYFESGKSYVCGERHLVQTSEGIKFAKYAKDNYNIELEGYDKIIDKIEESFGEVCDIAIDDPHLYVTNNGYVHHNTSLAKALCNEVGCDYLFLNGSSENGIDTFRTKITNYASSVSLSGGKKVIIIDEADFLTPQVFAALRAGIESFSKNCTFILTGNFKNKFPEAIQSRCSSIDFSLSKEEKKNLISKFFKRVCFILEKENISYDKSSVAEFITKYYPDNRKILNELQKYSISGNVDVGILAQVGDVNLKDLIKYLKTKDFTKVREWIVTNLDNDYNTIYRKIYDGMYSFLKPNSIPAVVLIIAKYQFQTGFVADPEIQLLSCMTEIMVDAEFV